MNEEIEAVGRWMVVEGVGTVGFDIPMHLLKIAQKMKEKAKGIEDAGAREMIEENAAKVLWTGLLLGAASGEVVKQLEGMLVAHELMGGDEGETQKR